MSSSVRIPPPNVSGTKHLREIASTISSTSRAALDLVVVAAEVVRALAGDVEVDELVDRPGAEALDLLDRVADHLVAAELLAAHQQPVLSSRQGIRRVFSTRRRRSAARARRRRSSRGGTARRTRCPAPTQRRHRPAVVGDAGDGGRIVGHGTRRSARSRTSAPARARRAAGRRARRTSRSFQPTCGIRSSGSVRDPLDRARDQVEPLVLAELGRARRQQLHPEADAEQRPARSPRRRAAPAASPRSRSARDRVAERADARAPRPARPPAPPPGRRPAAPRRRRSRTR